MKLIKLTATTLALCLLVVVGCNKDNAVNQSDITTDESLKTFDGLRTCATHEHNQELMNSDLSFARAQEAIEAYTERFSKMNAQQRVVVTIPVVFHVVYKSVSQNVTDAQINAQLDVLNKDFRKLNPDVSGVPSLFAGLVADCEINFCLAKRTPTGAATTGIVRVETKKPAFNSNNQVKSTASGGSDAWDASKYLNIWVCDLGKNLLGYAQFPGGAVATDGVVVAYGTLPGGSDAPYNLGRTATHEVGHYLNLRHIWGDDSAGCTGSDLVNDTPNQAGANYGCPTFPKITCTNSGDMSMNFMDYTNDACMYMFTAGQKARVQALFGGGARSSLATSNGCTPP